MFERISPGALLRRGGPRKVRVVVTTAQELEEFRTRKTRWAALAALAVGLALIVLDGTIVGVSMPTIINGLNLDIAGAQWVTS